VVDTGFVGLHVMISISDPWEFASENRQAVAGSIREFSLAPRAVFLVHLDQPVKQGDTSSREILASVRHVGFDPSILAKGQIVPCNFFGVPDRYRLSEYEGSYISDLSFIGGMKLVSQ
jgi:hypothetical protein